MGECYRCGDETDVGAHVCDVCARTDLVELHEGQGEEGTQSMECPLCSGSGRCFYCSAGGPCYHCSGSGREMPGSEAECHVCGPGGDADKGCEMCSYTRRCKHCGGTGKVPTPGKG